MRTTLQIDDDILEEARELAHAQRRSLGSVISDLARQTLRRPVGIKYLESGIPVFDAPEGTRIASPEEIQRIIDEEIR
jgi:hypothetical protein